MADPSSTATHKDSFFYLRGDPRDPQGVHRVDLDRDPSVYAVRFKPGQRKDSPTLSRGARRFLQDDSVHLSFIANNRLQVYQGAPRDVRERRTSRVAINAVRAGIRNLGRQEGVDYASPGYRISRGARSRNVMFVNNHFLVRFRPDVSDDEIERLNREHRVRILERVTYAESSYLMELIDERDGDRVIAVANAYFESDLTEYAHPDFMRRRHFKTVAAAGAVRGTTMRTAREDAPEFLDEQWHLDVANVRDAWNVTEGSEQIVIAILDDGVDTGHVEFSSKLVGGHDFGNGTDDPTPKMSWENHGTSVAGVATAGGTSARGVAPGCRLMAIKTPDFLGTADEAEMFRWVSDSGADVINCSWGPEDGTGAIDPLPDIVRDAIHYCVTSGRGGKGIPIFWAAGNGGESVSDDGYASNPEIIAVAASTENDVRASYSDFGPEVWIAAPSSGSRSRGDRAIFTTDRRGADGYNSGESDLGDPSGNYTNDFGGTSSASPLAAGVGGLMLSTNADLTWQQVKDLLRDTAEKIPDASHYDSDGHSDEFGYGRVDAHAAVTAASNATPGATGTGGATPTRATTGPSITGPACWGRSNRPPQFQVNRGPNGFYAVEVASTPSFMLEREGLGDDFFATYFDDNPNRRFISSSTYELPEDVWSRMKSAPRLFYRIWTSSSDQSWDNVDASTTDDDLGEDMPSINLSGCDHAPGAARTITYPSGATFEEVAAPDDGVDYSDPVADGAVPLIDVRDRRGEKLSENFTVDELDARDGASYARLSPELLAGLQRLRDRLGEPLIINSGYRHPKLNKEVGGVSGSRHQAGQAADIRTESKSTLQLARLALEEIGCDIGIGLGKNSIHVDVRGASTSWVYEGAELDEGEFDQWVRETCEELRRSRLARNSRLLDKEPLPAPPTITGPDTHSAKAEPPVFAIEPGPGRYFGVEVATNCELFDPANSGDRGSGNFFASYEGADLLPSPGGNRTGTWQLPVDAWRQLTSGLRLYYRVVVGRTRQPGSFTSASTRDDDCSEAPWIDITGGRAPRRPDPAEFLSIAELRKADEQLWRKEG